MMGGLFLAANQKQREMFIHCWCSRARVSMATAKNLSNLEESVARNDGRMIKFAFPY